MSETTAAPPPAPVSAPAPPVDPNAGFETPIPPAVRRQAERAAALQTEYAHGVARQTAELEAAISGKPIADAAESGTGPGQSTPAPAAPASPAPVPQGMANTGAGSPAPTPTEAAPPDVSAWEQRYRTLEGKYSAELPRLQQQLGAAQSEIARLHAQAERAEIERLTAPAPRSQIDVPQEDIETFGADLVSASQRWSRAGVEPEIAELRQQQQQLRQQMQQVARTAAERDVEARLAASVPNWQQIDRDVNFHEWLARPDVFSGQSNHPRLVEAYRAGDAARVVNIFQAYLREHTVPNQGGTQPIQTTPPISPSAGQAGRLPLETLAAPGTVRSGSTNGASEPPIIRRAEVKAFYDAIIQGHYRGRDAARQAREAEINAAFAAQRVV